MFHDAAGGLQVLAGINNHISGNYFFKDDYTGTAIDYRGTNSLVMMNYIFAHSTRIGDSGTGNLIIDSDRDGLSFGKQIPLAYVDLYSPSVLAGPVRNLLRLRSGGVNAGNGAAIPFITVDNGGIEVQAGQIASYLENGGSNDLAASMVFATAESGASNMVAQLTKDGSLNVKKYVNATNGFQVNGAAALNSVMGGFDGTKATLGTMTVAMLPVGTVTNSGSLTAGVIPQGVSAHQIIDGPMTVSAVTNVSLTGKLLADSSTLTNGVTLPGLTITNLVRVDANGKLASVTIGAGVGFDGTTITAPGTGEINTASNVGSGAGVFKQKTVSDLELRSLTNASSKMTVTQNTSTISLDVVEANLTLSSIGGAVTTSQLPTGQDAAKIGDATVTTTKFLYLANVISDIQTQFTGKQATDSDLTALSGTATTGLYTVTGAGTSATRTITGSAKLSVTNGDGVAGNPTLTVLEAGLDPSLVPGTVFVKSVGSIECNTTNTVYTIFTTAGSGRYILTGVDVECTALVAGGNAPTFYVYAGDNTHQLVNAATTIEFNAANVVSNHDSDMRSRGAAGAESIATGTVIKFELTVPSTQSTTVTVYLRGFYR